MLIATSAGGPQDWATIVAALPPFPASRKASGQPDRLDAAGLSVRPAVHADLPMLADYHARSGMAELALLPWTTAEKQAFLHDQFALQHRHYMSHFAKADFWVVCVPPQSGVGGEVGRLYLDRSAAEWRIVDVLLDPALRGRGLGTALIGWVQQEAAAHGAAALALNVAANNPRAHALYLRLGFEDVEGSDGPYQPMVWLPVGAGG